MLPCLLPNDGLVALGGLLVLDGEDEAVVRASDDLRLAADDPRQFQARLRLLVVLGDGEIRDLLHVSGVQVLDRCPPAEDRSGPIGSERDEEDGEDREEAVRTHLGR